MWVYCSGFMVSAVEDRNNNKNLMIRARLRGHLEEMSKKHKLTAEISTTPDGDYRFRMVISKAAFSAVMVEEVCGINYDNFKNSIRDHRYHEMAVGAWLAGKSEQSRQEKIEYITQEKSIHSKGGTSVGNY